MPRERDRLPRAGHRAAPGTAAIRALFGLGLFSDVRLQVNGDELVVIVEERPTVAEVGFTGLKEFDAEVLKKALRDIGLADGRPFDRALADLAARVGTDTARLERTIVRINTIESTSALANLETIDAATLPAVLYTVLLAVAGLIDNVLKPLMLGRGVEAPMPVILVALSAVALIKGSLTVVIAILGLLFTDQIETVARNLWITATMLIVFGVILVRWKGEI